ncbi:hypothetical protein GQX74_005446 [Glossina fuscipes]|nr:hypothetical protein GQX74_005446 [Glossina fuscipes]
MVKIETKGDKTENRVLIECHFHYLDIQAVESKRPSHFCIVTNDRPYNFATTGDAGNFSSNADVILTDLASAIKQIFPTVPLKYIIRKAPSINLIESGPPSIATCLPLTPISASAGTGESMIQKQDLKVHVTVSNDMYQFCAIHLAGPIAKVSKGLCKLALAHCGLTSKGVNQMSHSLSLNQSISNSLTYLDLSGNNLKDDITNLHNFLAQPNVLEYLDLSSTDITLENLFGALLRGCATHLSHLNVSHNSFSTKKGKEIPPSFKQFFTNLDAELAPVLTAISKNPSIRTLYMCRSLTGMKLKHVPTVMDALVNLIQKDDFPLAELILSENKLKNDIHDFINALGSNQSLQKLDISGNYMGDVGARLLAKALQINNKLRFIYLDKNNITLQGYADIVYALENNYNMRAIPFPVFDIAPHLKSHPDKTDAIMRKMQELLQRNCNGLKRTPGQGFRLQHGFMLSSTHQLVDKLVAETQDTISMAKSSCDSTTSSSAVQRLIDDAENCKQLMPKLQEAVRCETHPVEVKLTRIASELSYTIQSYLEETLETMIRTAVEQCPKTLGSQMVVQDLRKMLSERLLIPEDFLQNCLLNNAGSEIMNRVSEIEQSLAATISDRATDEVLEALTRYRRGLGIADSPSILLDEPQTPDIVRSRSSHDTDGIVIRPGRGSILPKLGLESPTATPHMPTKRRSMARKVRPQSVVENLSLGHIPDLLESPSSHRSTSQISRRDSSINGDNMNSSRGALDDGGGDECCDSITELPSASFQLQHLVKGRPKRAKTRAPTRPLVTIEGGATKEIGEGLDQFFRPGSVTPTTLTPLVSPTSEECSSLSFADSPTMSRNGNDHMTSEETTPILEERKPIKLERSSPLLRGAAWATRSRSTDNLEKYSPLVGRKSPLVKMRAESGGANHIDGPEIPTAAERLLKTSSTREDKLRSPSNDSIKSHTEGSSVIMKTGNGILRTPIVLQKPRPWSVVGSNEQKTGVTNNSSCDYHGSESTKTTPEKLEEEVEVLPFGQNTGGSIVGITPGIAIAQGGTGGGSIVGITPGAALGEKKSVRELAAGLNRMDLPLKPKVLPRSLLTSTSSLSKTSGNFSSSISSSIATTSSSVSTAITTSTHIVTAKSDNSMQTCTSQSHRSTKITSTTGSTTISETVSETNRKSVFTELNGSQTVNTNETLNTGNSKIANTNGFINGEKRSSNDVITKSTGGFKRIAGKEISALFEV